MTIQEMKRKLLDDNVVKEFRGSYRVNPGFTRKGLTLEGYFSQFSSEFQEPLSHGSELEAVYRIVHELEGDCLCPFCGKPRLFRDMPRGFAETCGSWDCRQALMSQTCSDRYGVSNYTKTQEFKDKHKQTCLERYGVDSYSKTQECQDKRKSTCMQRYGETSYSKTPEFRQRFESACLDKFGVKTPLQSKECREKGKKTCLERYGAESYAQTAEFQEKFKATLKEHYGVEHPMHSKEVKERAVQTMQEHFGVPYAMQSKEVREKSKQTCLEKYGVGSYTQTPDFSERYKQTCLEKYGVENFAQSSNFNQKFKETCMKHFGVPHNMLTQESKDKIRQTCMERYGVPHNMMIPECREKFHQTCMERYGVPHPSQNPEIAHKMFSHKGPSGPERKLIECLTQRGLEFQYQYHCNGKNFDFAIFQNGELAVLVEVDGEYFHGLTSDTDGCQVHGETDCERFQRVPEGVKLVVCDSLRIEECISEILACLNVSYEGWIQEIVDSLPKEFPYPEYPEERIRRDYRHLCEWEEFQPKSRVCDSAIRQFHKSIWSARVGNNPSPVEAWSNPKLLERCVRNRFIYSSSLSSQAIANGFNVCKIAPKVSVFSAGLAKRLVRTYLQSFSEVFDPFSGFSGRMLGTCACGKKYIGQDLSGTAVSESGKLRDFLNLNAELSQRDVMESSGTYECLFTCSPYGLKETWNNEGQQDLKCDDWIDVCLKNFQCRRYLFVVDDPGRYRDYVVEELENASHLGSNSEYVVCIDREV